MLFLVCIKVRDQVVGVWYAAAVNVMHVSLCSICCSVCERTEPEVKSYICCLAVAQLAQLSSRSSSSSSIHCTLQSTATTNSVVNGKKTTRALYQQKV